QHGDSGPAGFPEGQERHPRSVGIGAGRGGRPAWFGDHRRITHWRRRRPERAHLFDGRHGRCAHRRRLPGRRRRRVRRDWHRQLAGGGDHRRGAPPGRAGRAGARFFGGAGGGVGGPGPPGRGAGGADAGEVRSDTTLAGVTIGGSLVGGGGVGGGGRFGAGSGRIFSTGAMGVVRVVGSVRGGGGANSGVIVTASTLAGVTIGGSLLRGVLPPRRSSFFKRALGAVRVAPGVPGAE